MATLINGTTLNADITLTKQTGTKVVFDTDQKYVQKDIEINIAAQTATPSFKGGALNNKDATAAFTNMTTSTTNTSGVVIATSGQAGRAAIQYNGAINGWVSASNNGTAMSALSTDSWTGETYYATGVTLTNNKTFNITVPDGNSTVTYTISVDNEGNVSGIGEGAAITIWDEVDENGGYIRHIRGVDLSGDTVSPSSLLQGYTAHNALGEPIVGTATQEGGGTINLQAKTNITPTESSQTITPDTGYDGLSRVQINPISSTYIGSEIPLRSSTDLTSSGATVTVPAGYYDAQTTKSVATGSIGNYTWTSSTASNSKTYTANFSNFSAGYISSIGTVAHTFTLQSATITPGTTQQTVTPTSNNHYINSVTIAGDSDLIASNIKSGVSIFGVTGTYTGDGGSSSEITLQAKTHIVPTESSQTITADSGYDGLSSVQIDAISSTYVGTGITRRSSTDLTASGATVTVPAGYYAEQATKSVATMTLPTTAASSATSGYTSKATIGRSTSAQYINIPVGYNTSGAYYVISATPNGIVTAPSSVSGSAATVSTGTNTLTLTKTVSITPNVTTAGYISSGTAGNATVTLTANVTTKAAATITPGTTNQTIASGTYLTGTQTIAGDANLIAANIKAGTSIFNINGTYTSDATASAADIVNGETAYVNGRMLTGTLVIQKYYTGSSAPSASLGANGDIYIQQ